MKHGTKRSAGIALFGMLGAVVAPAQESVAHFDAPVVVTDSGRRITALLDFDGDGDLDAAGWWQHATNAFRVSTWTNDGAGRLDLGFEVSTTSSSAYTLKDLATGDVDGDGLDDLVYAAGGVADVIDYYVADGTGGFVFPAAWWVSEPSLVTDLLIADFDGDGRGDVARTNVAGQLRIALTLPSGPAAPASITLPSSGEHILFRADVNGDSTPDLGVAIHGLGTVLAFFPVVGGAPTAGPVFVLPGVADPMPAAGDIDGDGDEDIVVFEMTQYRVLRRTGPATFALEGPVAGGPATDLVDVDGDGDLDGVCCGGGGGGGGGGGTPLPPNSAPSIFRVSRNAGGVFAPAFEIPGLGAEHIAGAADVDADGDVDLVAGRCAYYAPGPLLAAPQAPTGVASPSERRIADLDRDGDLDLQVALASVHRNSADGTFASFGPVTPAAPPGTAFAGPGYPGDFDGDGDVDLVVEHRAGATLLAMRLLRNNGGGGFADAGDAGAPGVPFGNSASSLAADADGDGDLDLFVVPPIVLPLQPTKLWLNDGAGFFSAGPNVAELVKEVADFTGDGLPDLLVASVFLAVRPGLGGGAFGPAVNLGPLTDAFNDRPAVADFDGDGDLDVVRPYGDSAFLETNTGTGTFMGGWVWLNHFAVGAGLSRRVFATDVNQDGLPDVVLSPPAYAANGSSIFVNNSASYLSFVVPGVTQILRADALADVDGDGDEDVVAASVVRNRSLEGPAAGSKRQYGAGLAGSGGMIPTLGEAGPFRMGMPCELRVTGAVGGSLGIMAMGDQPIDVPAFGGSLLVNPVFFWTFIASGPFGEPGAGTYVLPWTVTPPMAGITFYKQAGLIDPAAPQWIAITNAIRVTTGL
jgi:hypothetical protein